MAFENLTKSIRLNSEEFTFQFQSHPNYPSALAFSDTLNFLGVKNDAYELEKEYWEELPEEFIALVDHSFSLVKKEGNNYTVISELTKGYSKEELYSKSGNFVMLFEKTDIVKENSTFNFKPFIYALFSIIILYSFVQLRWFETVFNILSFFGVYLCLELFNQKFGQESTVVNNLCGTSVSSGNESSCSKIFTSDKINFLGLKLADFSLIYFLSIAILGVFLPETQVFLRISALVTIAVILYSVHIQSFVEKSICKVCVIIILILVSQIVLSSLYFDFLISVKPIFYGLIFFLAFFFGILFVNNLLEENEKLKKSNTKNFRFKRNYKLFKRELLEKEKVTFQSTNFFSLGNNDSKFHLSLVSSPYCGFCKDAHTILEKLLEKYPNDISAQIRFNFSETGDKSYKSLMTEFINIYENKPENEFLQTINFWFENKDLKKLKEKNNFQNQVANLQSALTIGEENQNLAFNFTPIILINGYQFPDKYDREDIFYFIDELLEDEDILK